MAKRFLLNLWYCLSKEKTLYSASSYHVFLNHPPSDTVVMVVPYHAFIQSLHFHWRPISFCRLKLSLSRKWTGGWMMCWKSLDKTAMDFKDISKLLSWWLIICCIHSQDSKSPLTKLTPSLFFFWSSVFFSGSLPTFLFVSGISLCLLLFFAE